MVVLDGSSLPVGELLAAGPAGPERPTAPVRDRPSRWLAAVAALLVAGGVLSVPGLRAAEARDRADADVVEVAAALTDVGTTLAGGAGPDRVALRLALQVRNSGPRAVRVTAARVVPALEGVVAVPSAERVASGGATGVAVDVAASCADADRLADLGRDRLVEVGVRAASGRERLVAVDVSAPLQRLARGACRRDPLDESLVLGATDASLTTTRLSFVLEVSRDTTLGGQLVSVGATGLRVQAAGLPGLLPETGVGAPLRVPVTIEVADCTRLRLNPRGYLLQLSLVVADGTGARRTVVQGTGNDSARLNRLGAGLLSRNCGFDPLFRTA